MNRKTIIAVTAALLVGIIIGSQIRCGKGQGTRDGRRILSIRHDTIVSYVTRIDTFLRTVASYVPVPYRVAMSGASQAANEPANCQLPPDIAFYADTLRQKDAFKAVILDTVLGRILGRSVQWADLSPLEVKTVTNTITIEKKQSPVKVYLGADAYAGRAAGKYNFDIAPSASIVIGDRYMLDLGYYILNEQVTAGLKVKLSFRK